jgi:CRISPR-associated protein Cas1
MANKPLPIEKVRKLLHLKFKEKLSYRAIGQALGIGYMSACYLVQKFVKSGQTWPTELTDDELRLLLYQQQTPYRPVRVLPNFKEVKQRLEGGSSIRREWLTYLSEHPDGYRYKRFRELYQLWCENRLDVTSHPLPLTQPEGAHKSKLIISKQEMTQIVFDQEECIGEALRKAEGYWHSQVNDNAVLTLAGHGARLTVERDELVVFPGTSATTVKEPARRLARAVHGIKAIVIVGYAGYLTLDAIEWLAQQKVGLYTLDLVGDLCLNLIPAISPHRPIQRRAQYTANPFTIARSIMREKLGEAIRVKPALALPYRWILNDISSIGTLDMLRQAEGRAANLYWNQWNFELDHHRDFPEHWRTFSNRSSPLTGSGRKAVHPVNAMLNYGYTVLAGRIERALVFDGYDPAAGTLHAAMDGRASLAWDLIELLRPTVDEQLINWAQTQKWRKRDFEVNDDGVVYLRQQLARIVIQKSWIPDAKIKQVIRWYAGQLVGREEKFEVG